MTETVSNANRKKLRDEYLEWLLLDRFQRAAAGLPESDVEWGKAKGVATRTLRSWKSDEDFTARLEERQTQQAARLTPGATVTAGSYVAGDGSADGDYLAIRAKLITMAAAGDKTAIDTYFKTYGKSFVEEENASRKSDFRDWEDEQLVGRLLEFLSDETVFAEADRRRALAGGSE